jgi:hypothetical protein
MGKCNKLLCAHYPGTYYPPDYRFTASKPTVTNPTAWATSKPDATATPTSKKILPNCDNPVKPEARFYESCGTKLQQTPTE